MTKKNSKKKQTPPKKTIVKSAPLTQGPQGLAKWGPYLLAIVAFLLYANTLGHQFAFDDSIVITDNQFTQKGLAGIPDLMTKDFFEGIYGNGGMELSGGRYRPLSLVSFAIENQLFGKEKKVNGQRIKDNKGHQLYEYNPFIGHLLNVLLYALTGFLLFQVLGVFFKDFPELKLAMPLLAGLLFICHPIHTEVVANIKSRDEILALILLLFSFKALFQRADKGLKPLSFGLGLLAYFAAMLAKEHAFTFIVIFPFSLLVFRRSLNWSQIARFTAPFWLVALAYFMLRSAMVGGIAAETNTDMMENPFYGVDFLKKFGTIALILWYYIQLMIFPHPLASDYSREEIPLVGFDHPLAILGLLLYLGMALWVILKIFRKDIFAFNILLYFIPLSLTTNILFNIGAPMADRFLYVPSLGVAIAMAYGLCRIFQLKSISEIGKKPIMVGILAIFIVGFSIKTLTRNPNWRDNETLFAKDVQSSSESAKMNYYYANTLFKKYLTNTQDSSQLQTAYRHFKKAVDIYPNFHTSRYNLGFIELQRKNAKAAEGHFLTILEQQPGHILSIEQLGRVYGELLRDFPKAEKYLLQAVQINTQRGASANLASNYQGLGIIYSMQSQFDKAIPVYLEAIKLAPNIASNYLNLGITYQQKGDAAKGQEYINKAVALDPSLRR